MGCHPARWLWGLIPVAMLGWLAVHGKSDAIEHDLEQRSTAALSAAGHEWASVAFSGRDGLLVGHAGSERDIDVAADLVRGVWGVRVVDVRAAASDMVTTPPPLPQPSPIRTKSRPLEEFVPIPVAAASAPDALLADGGPRSVAAVATAPGERVAVALRHEAHAVLKETAAADPVRPDDDAPGDVIADTLSVTPLTTADAPVPAALEEKAAEGTAAPEADVTVAEESHAPVNGPAGPKEATGPAQTSAAAGSALNPEHVVTAESATTIAAAEPSSATGESGSRQETSASEARSVTAPSPQATAPTVATVGESQHGVPSPDARTTDDLPAAVAAVQAPSLPMAPLPERRHVASPLNPRSLENGLQATPPDAPPSAAASASPGAPETDAEQPPRFETAALPQGNMGPDAPCTEDVRSAAKQVEVHFARGDARLDRSGKALLDRLVVTLDACPTAALRIAGHADATGIARRNLALSKRRARTVVSYLVDKGIDAGRLAAVGYGETRPVAPNTTRANRARNRRIEVDVAARAWPPAPVRKQGTHNGLSRR